MELRSVWKVKLLYVIVCLSPKVVTMLGGAVQSLYEEWQMKIKYSEFSHPSLRISQESDGNGPLHLRSCKLRQLKVGFLSKTSFHITLMLAPRVVTLLPELLRLDQLDDSGNFN